MVANPPLDLTLAPLNGEPRELRAYLAMFHLVVVALDPFTNESAWILPTAARILRVYDQADCHVAWLVTGTADECRQFLGPLSREFLTFADPDRNAMKALDLDALPALVHIAIDGTVVNAAEGWDPYEWRAVTDVLSKQMSWSKPTIPDVNDPAPYPGTPAFV